VCVAGGLSLGASSCGASDDNRALKVETFCLTMSLLHRTELNLSSEEGDDRPPDGTGYSFGSLADIYVKDEEKSNLVANLPRSYTNGDYACVFFLFIFYRW